MSSNINVSPSPLAGEGWGEGAQATTSEVDNIAIRVSNLSKCYTLYDAPRDRLKQFIFPRIQRLAKRSPRSYYREFWALKDVSFVVKKGETVGIIGRNGSGKSTLLQIICGTLTPSSGAVETRGRIAALLELGSGFNPEFTGRENVYMNGAVLGLSKEEIDARYDDIAAFADIGDFIDQPVKTYSSGMLVRLAFAVQVQLDPEILIVDEALAVGDAGFQLKCMLRMRDLQDKGVTVLFVSHDTGSILRLCDRAILLDQGSMKSDSRDTLGVVKQYERITRYAPMLTAAQVAEHTSASYADELGGITETRLGTRMAEYVSVEFFGEDGRERSIFESGDEIEIRAVINSHANFLKAVSGFTLKNKAGVDIWGDNTLFANTDFSLAEGLTWLSYRFRLHLPAGEYFLYIGLADISGERVELDQRWPVRKLNIVSTRQVLGFTFAPANISVRQLV